MTEGSFFVFSPFSPCHRPVVPKIYSGSWTNADESWSVSFYWSEQGSGGFSALASEAIKPSELSVWRFGISSGHCKGGQIMQTCSVITTSSFALTMTQNTFHDSLSKTEHNISGIYAGSKCVSLTCDLLPLSMSSFGTLRAGILRYVVPFYSCGMCILQASPGAGLPGRWKSCSCGHFSRTLVSGQPGMFSVRQYTVIMWWHV